MKATGISVSLDWQLKSSRLIDKLPPEEKHRTCCCCHIKTGTLTLGLVELVAVAFLFTSIIQQLIWKHGDRSLCAPGERWKDCLIFNFSHFNITLAGDYVIALLMISIMLSVSIVLLFYGIITVSPSFLIPHIIVQAFGLIFSLGYFVLYAWSYFYGDLHTQKRIFEFQTFVERMWLASILLIFSAFQCYLFMVVIKCTLYLQTLSNEHKRKTNQFNEVSERVRIAKENGLWRQNSWGGGFQQYKGQYEEETRRKERRKDKPVNRVQWDLQNNEEKSISVCPSEKSETHHQTKHKIVVDLDKEPKKPALKSQPQAPKQLQQQKSVSSTSNESGGKNSQPPPMVSSSHHSKRRRTAENSSPTRLHKTDSAGSNRSARRMRVEDKESGSPSTKKKQRPKDQGAVAGGELPSPKAHHRHHQPKQKERDHHHKKEGGEGESRSYVKDQRPRQNVTTCHNGTTDSNPSVANKSNEFISSSEKGFHLYRSSANIPIL
ncbi:hypothetical protein FO519_006745 [Halicephalobus sp. NKZ332]|nr:hypothetical protein FO519_006745 [Halicephalobus sp. NKZ332]